MLRLMTTSNLERRLWGADWYPAGGEHAIVMAQKLKTGGYAQPDADLVKLPGRPIPPSLWLWPTFAA
jgi:hypothetical protein